MYGKCNKCKSCKSCCDPCKKDECGKHYAPHPKSYHPKNEYGYDHCKPEPCCRPSCGCKGSRVILSSSGRTYYEKPRCPKKCCYH